MREMIEDSNEARENEPFRFGKRKEYEQTLARLAREGADDLYEQLVEEYIRFCDVNGS